MPAFDSVAIAALVIAALLLLLLLARRRRIASDAGRADDSDDLDTVQAWPPQAVRVMTLPERLAYATLRRAFPNRLVLAQVPLSRFISVDSGHSYAQWLACAGRLNVDLVVCDRHSRVIAAVEVRPTDQTPASIARHQRLAQVLQAAEVKVHVWSELHLPTVAEVRQLFKRKGDVAVDDPDADSDDRRLLPLPEMQELLMAGDELDYNQEPVPSGFFDDLDPAPAARHARA